MNKKTENIIKESAKATTCRSIKKNGLLKLSEARTFDAEKIKSELIDVSKRIGIRIRGSIKFSFGLAKVFIYFFFKGISSYFKVLKVFTAWMPRRK